jgi:hypothetical protein
VNDLEAFAELVKHASNAQEAIEPMLLDTISDQLTWYLGRLRALGDTHPELNVSVTTVEG